MRFAEGFQLIGSQRVIRRPATQKRSAPVETGAPLVVRGGGNLWLRLRLSLRLRLRVVLLVIDVLRRAILFPVDLLIFGCRQRSTIGLAVCGNLFVDALLLILQLGSFASGQLAALHTLRDAVLLVFAALTDFVVAVVRHVGVVLVLINLLGKLILLSVDLFFPRGSQFAAIGRAIPCRFLVDGRFLLFQVRGF